MDRIKTRDKLNLQTMESIIQFGENPIEIQTVSAVGDKSFFYARLNRTVTFLQDICQ